MKMLLRTPMMRTPVKTVAVLLLVSLLLLLFVVPVFAIAEPDTAPTINNVFIHTNLLETGDVGVLIDYYLDYAVPPTETATDAFLGIFVDIDSSTQLRATAPYTFQGSGYGRGIIWIYFNAADAATYSLDSVDQALYRVWLTGNPALSWVPGPDPPKTIATVDEWQTTGDSAVLLAQRILFYAQELETDWSQNMIESTALGNRLTTLGASYFENAIPSLRTMAPAAFAAGTVALDDEGLDWSTSFGAIVTGANIAGSPVTLVSGVNTVTATGVGDFTVDLNRGTTGSAANGTAVVTGLPSDLVAGTTTLTVTGAGTITITVQLTTTQEGVSDSVTGTGLDLGSLATAFGMSRLMLSSLVWLGISVVACAMVLPVGGGRNTLLVFDFMLLLGGVLGLFSVLMLALLFILFGIATGYVLFFRGASA